MGTLVFEGLDDARAIACLSAALGSPFEVSGAAHLPASGDGKSARTLLRVEHFPDSVEYRLAALAKMLAAFGTPRRMEAEEASVLWCAIRDCAAFVAPSAEAVWRLSVAPTRAPEIVQRIARQRACRWFYDWGGGIVWLATEADADCGAGAIRAEITAIGGHATLVRAPEEVRARLEVFQPLSAPLMKLTAGIKASFDPDGVLNPGRMYPGV